MHTISGVTAIFMWGFLALLSVYTKSVPPFQLLSICFITAFALLVLKRLVNRNRVFEKPALTLNQWYVSILGLFGFHFCYFMAIRFAPAVEVSLIGYLWPLLLGVLVAPRALRVQAFIGGVFGFFGAGLLVLNGQQLGVQPENLVGYLLALACAFIWSGYSWFLSRSPTRVDDIGWVALFSSFLSLGAHLLFEQTYWPDSFFIGLAVLFLGLGPVGGAFYLWDIGMKRGNQQLLASLSFSTPVISTLILWAFGLAQLSVIIATSVTCILIGAALANGMLERIINRSTEGL